MASKAAEREAADLQAARDREHARILREVQWATADEATMLRTVAEVLDEQAEHITEVKRSAWQGRARARRAAADEVRGLVALLNANPAPTEPRREPLDTIPSPDRHADLDPADGPVSARITDKVLADGPVTPRTAAEIRRAIEAESDTDAKLDAALGGLPMATDAVGRPVQISWDDRGNSHIGYAVGDTVTVGGIEFTKISDDPFDGRPTLAAPDPFVNWPPASVTRPRMTLAEVHEHARTRARGADHRSHSQITGFEECGVRYALSDRERVPQWWNVGGNAVHTAIEDINRAALTGGAPVGLAPGPLTEHWNDVFRTAVAETEYLSGVPHEAWRAASRGAEAYDWWRVEGELMVERWIEYLRRRYQAGWTIHAIEQEYRLPVDGVPVPVLCILDVVFERDAGWTASGTQLYDIVDIKAGKSAPREGFQIGGLYHWALWCDLTGAGWTVANAPDISQSFWLARQADPVNQTVQIDAWPWPDVVHRVSMMDRAERAGLYAPRPSNFCGSCAVNDLCPVGPR